MKRQPKVMVTEFASRREGFVEDKWYSPEDIATMLDINVQTVRRAIRAGALTASRFGKLWRVREKDLFAFMEMSKEKKHARK